MWAVDLDSDINTVADALYGLPLEEFIPARTAAEKRARTSGDRELATRIRALGKPNVVGWLVNQLVRERPQDIQPWLELGEELRAATVAGEGERLRALGPVQRQTVGALIDDAVAIASRADRAVSADVRRTLTETLRAALADADAARELQQARLTTGLYRSGLGGSVNSGAGSARATPPLARIPPGAPRADADPTAADQHADQRAHQLRQARALLDDARERAEEARIADEAARQAVSVATAAAARAQRDAARTQAELARACRAAELAEQRVLRIES